MGLATAAPLLRLAASPESVDCNGRLEREHIFSQATYLLNILTLKLIIFRLTVNYVQDLATQISFLSVSGELLVWSHKR